MRTARVRFRSQIASIRRDLDSGYDMRGAYERRGDRIGMSYAQFRRYVRDLLPDLYARVRRGKRVAIASPARESGIRKGPSAAPVFTPVRLRGDPKQEDEA